MGKKNQKTEEIKVDEELKNVAEIEENKIEEFETSEEIKDENTIEEYVSVRKTPWVDFTDNNYQYKQGDKYPREGYIPTKERIKELFDYRKNKLGEVLIVKKKDLEEE